MARSRQAARLPSLDTTQPPLRASLKARSPRRLRPTALPGNHRSASRYRSRLHHGTGLRPRLETEARLTPPARAPHYARQTQPDRARPGAQHPTRRRLAPPCKRRDCPRSIQQPAARLANARAPRRLRPSPSPANHRFALRLTLALARRRRASPSPGNRTAARSARARSALRETDTAGPRTARRSAPHAKARGAVTPRGETSLARYNNHRFALRRQLALRDGCGLRPGLTTTAARLAPPAHAPRCARQKQPVRSRPGARHPTRRRVARSRQAARLPSLDTTQPPLRASLKARSPRRLRPTALPGNHRSASRYRSRLHHGTGLRPRLETEARLTPPARAPHYARQTQPDRARPGAQHPTRRRLAPPCKRRDCPRSIQQPAARLANARAPRRLRPSPSPANHRFALRLTLALARRRRASPSPGNRLAPPARAPRCARQNCGSLRPRALRVARDRHSRSAHGPALGTPREGAWRGHAKGRDFPRSIQQPPLRASLSPFATAAACGLA